MTDISVLDYHLPEELIAHMPADKRDASRLMVVDRKAQSVTHAHFCELPNYLPSSVSFIRNNAMVLKARIYAQRPTSGTVECLLLRPDVDPLKWWCLLRPGKKLKVGATFGVNDIFNATVIEKKLSGECLVSFNLLKHDSVIALSDALGQLPLPPYIKRESGALDANDDSRYQTVYADPSKKVAVAAPTAGLHFTDELMSRLTSKGCSFLDITLHVGLGTFQPISSATIEEHLIHTELYEIDGKTRQVLAENQKPRVVVGTTSLRALEDYARKADASDLNTPWVSEANIYIYPPSTFALADHLITNFHLPRTTLMCLVAAFLMPGKTDGLGWLKELYAEAIREKYRFYSYGDAMLIV